ncbi:MAG TPA: trehalase family glycosidase [Anaerolineales bacterium]|nr:trehalase family glycosidase [Anaerolineales bacterium]
MNTSLLKLLRDQIDITRVPFSERGSRLLVYQHTDRPSLYVKLAERLIRVEPGIESYLHRPPFIDDLCFIDEQGTPLEFTTTTSPDVLTFQTRLGEIRLAFQDETTLVFGLPAHTKTGIRFRARTTHWHKTETGGELTHVRNIKSGMRNGKRLRNEIREDGIDSLMEFIVHADDDCTLALHIADDDWSDLVKPFSAVSESAKHRWDAWFSTAPGVPEAYRSKYAYAWWVMANNLISPSGFVTREAMVPTKAFYVGVWLWDSALHALAYRHIDPELARNQIRVMLANQLSDGMLPDAIFDEGVVAEIGHPFHGRVTKPPILAWSAMKIHAVAPDVDFLKEIYEPLKRCNEWWFKHNDDDCDGVVQYTHPYSSGLDDSPLWDFGMPVESPDINTYLAMQMDCLAEMAEKIGRRDESLKWRNRSEVQVKRMIDHLWDEESGMFRALHDESPIPVVTPFNLLPLWAGKLPQNITKSLLAHLTNPDEFWGRYALPTVAYNDPAYDPAKMWRGPVWANINYFFVEALERIGRHGLAAELREKTLNLMTVQPGMREYYNSQTGKPPATAAPIFGWSAATFIDLAIQANEIKKEKIRNDG